MNQTSALTVHDREESHTNHIDPSSHTSPWLEGHRTPELEGMLRAVGIECLDERYIECYLRTARRLDASQYHDALMGNILLAAFEGFAASRGITIEGVTRVRKDENERPPAARTRLIEVEPGLTRPVLQEGLVFLSGGDGTRRVLKVEPNRICGNGIIVTIHAGAGDAEDFMRGWQSYSVRHAYLRGRTFYADGHLLEPPSERLDDVYLPDEVKALLRRMVLAFSGNVERHRARGLAAKRGLLFVGPPGTGKSMLCRALCAELRCTAIWLSAQHVRNPRVFADVWSLARLLQPTVVFLEDIDLYAENRDASQASSRLGELMNQMDGIEASDGILTIGTTNRPEVIEKALRNRPGRFDRTIALGPLPGGARREVLRAHFGPDVLDDAVLERLVSDTAEFSGARLVDLAKTLVELMAEESAEPLPDHGHRRVSMDAAIRALREIGACERRPGIGFVERGNASAGRGSEARP